MKVTDDTPVEIDYEFEPKNDFVEDSERVEVSVIGKYYHFRILDNI